MFRPLFLFTLNLSGVNTAQAVQDNECVNFVQGSDGYRNEDVYWFDFSKCNIPENISSDKPILVSKSIGSSEVSFKLK